LCKVEAVSESIVDVHLGDVLVGRIVRVNDTSTFTVDERYLSLSNRPVLGQVFEARLSPDERWIGRRNQLPTFFRHDLPEEDTLLRAAIAAEHGIKASDELGLLSSLGEDLPGAIVARRVEGASRDGAGEGPRLRFSLAGAHLKFSMIERDHALVLGADALAPAWIVKLYDERRVGMARNELSMMTLARAAGIEAPRCRLVSERELGALPSRFLRPSLEAIAIVRFDRAEGRRIPQEDFAQVFDVPATADAKYARQLPKGRKKLSYESIARVIARLCPEDVPEFARRLLFCIVIGNEDAHLKNWSLIYPDGVRARLSPAYDLVSTVVYDGLDRALALPLFNEARMDAVTMWHFEQLADSVGFERDAMRSLVRETLEALRETWARTGAELPLLDEHRAVLDQRIRARRFE
jgi:serine/threonine-protein kinase HipA